MPRRLIWYGQMTTRRRLVGRGLALLGGGVLWLSVFLTLPGLVLAAAALARAGDHGEIVWTCSLDNFRRLLTVETVQSWVGRGDEQQAFSRTSLPYLEILLRSLWVALVTTAFSIGLAFPLAFYIATRPPRRRYLWLAVVVIPFCTNLVIRASAWMLMLSSQSWLSRLARALGLLEADAGLYPGPLAVYLGMASSALPFAVLPLYASIERLDWSLLDAARDLYAPRRAVFRHAVLPQTLPGLSVAVILTFIPAMGMFVVPDLLGGGKPFLVGNLIQQQFGPSRDLPFGAAVSLGLMVLTLLGMFVLRRHGRGVEPT
ncbi:MAG: ABC transporter permease [Phycisphaerae bacterium]